MEITWHPIPRFNGDYEISLDGQIRRREGAFKWRPHSKILTAKANAKGYLRIGLRHQGQGSKNYFVHRLVAEVFLGKCPQGHCVNHIDANPSNNHISNLEYVTPAQNSAHAQKLGLFPSGLSHHYNKRPETRRRGENSFVNKLKEADVLDIRRRLSLGETKKSVANRYGISISHIKNIKRRLSWSHI